MQLAGPLAESFERGVVRLAGEPYALDWLLADVSFKVGRIFTNYSGDVSGRFLELAVLTSPPGRLSPPALDRLREILAKPMAPKEAFSLRKLFQVAHLPAEAQLSTIDKMAHQSRLRRALTPTQSRDTLEAVGC